MYTAAYPIYKGNHIHLIELNWALALLVGSRFTPTHTQAHRHTHTGKHTQANTHTHTHTYFFHLYKHIARGIYKFP